MTGFRLSTFLAGGLLAGAVAFGPPVLAQQSTGGATGTTSGPAAHSAPTLGTGGEVPASPHQVQVLRHKGGPAIRREMASRGGPGEPGQPGATDTESGKAPRVTGTTGGPSTNNP